MVHLPRSHPAAERRRPIVQGVSVGLEAATLRERPSPLRGLESEFWGAYPGLKPGATIRRRSAANDHCRFAAEEHRRGLILIIVLIVTILLSLAAYAFTGLMLAEYESAEVRGRGLQSRMVADSGQDFLLQLLTIPEEDRYQDVGDLNDNPALFQRVVIAGEQPNNTARFAVLAPRVDDEGNLTGAVRFGLENESARLNLNALLTVDQFQENGGRNLLMSLEEIGMTETIADSIMDFIDEDEEPREFGAESDYYAPLGVHIPNGPLISIEQLLEVQGIDGNQTLLFGADRNRNFVIDPDEQAYTAGMNQAAYGARGFSAYFTLHSAEKNAQPDGTPRIDLNNDDLQALYDDLVNLLDENKATFVIAFRQNGPYSGTMAPVPVSTGNLDFEAPGRNKLNTVLDLIGSNTQVKFKGEEETIVLNNPWPNPDEQAISSLKEDLPLLLDHCAVNTEETIPGRLNINQAPRYLLLNIPGLPEDDAEAGEIVDRILTDRVAVPDEENPDQRHETWLLTSNIVSLEEMKAMLPFVCARGDVYRAQVVGYFEEGGPASRYEVILDNSGATPKQLFWRDLSHLGLGFPRATLGVGGSMPQ